jgi:diacylglycerol kinase (ATP)
LVGLRIDKDEVRKRLIIPEYLKISMVEVVRNDEVVFDEDEHCWDDTNTALKSTIIVFVNSKSIGHRGPTLKAQLQKLLAKSRYLIS